MTNYMKNSKVLIIVALIGLTGTLGTALIANWDELFSSRPDVDSTATDPTSNGSATSESIERTSIVSSGESTDTAVVNNQAVNTELEEPSKKKIADELKRVEDIQERINKIRDVVRSVIYMGNPTSTAVQLKINDVEGIDIDDSFAEFVASAANAKKESLAKLLEIHADAVRREDEEKRLAVAKYTVVVAYNHKASKAVAREIAQALSLLGMKSSTAWDNRFTKRANGLISDVSILAHGDDLAASQTIAQAIREWGIEVPELTISTITKGDKIETDVGGTISFAVKGELILVLIPDNYKAPPQFNPK